MARWLGIWHPARPVREFVWSLAERAEWLVRGWRFIPGVLLIAILPLLIGWFGSSRIHQVMTGIGTAVLVFGCLPHDDMKRAMAIIGGIFLLHSAGMIVATVLDPDRAAAMTLGGEDYWQRIRMWVTTGFDHEYQFRHWGPIQLLMLIAVPIVAYSSFGVLPFTYGFEQIDLMNYYVGRLIPISESPVKAVVFGWHPWSMLRGMAYTILVFEMASWSLERLSGRTLSTRRLRVIRWVMGISLAIADALVKAAISPWLQSQLQANLR